MSKTINVCPQCDSSQLARLSDLQVRRRTKTDVGDRYYCRQCQEVITRAKRREAKGAGGRPPKMAAQIKALREDMQ